MSTSSLQESVGSDVEQKPIKVKILFGGNPVDSRTQSQSVPSQKGSPSETEDDEEAAFIFSGSDIMPKNSSSDASRVVTSTFEEEVNEEVVHNGWNLRSRKKRESKADGEDEEIGESRDSQKKLELPKLSITLTDQEIEDDIFAMTGSRPVRRPRRRSKALQKQLDDLFPGMRLGSITPKDYEVPEGSKKKKK